MQAEAGTQKNGRVGTSSHIHKPRLLPFYEIEPGGGREDLPVPSRPLLILHFLLLLLFLLLLFFLLVFLYLFLFLLSLKTCAAHFKT
jgi:hypothetical protein